jgi:hypothetical protein
MNAQQKFINTCLQLEAKLKAFFPPESPGQQSPCGLTPMPSPKKSVLGSPTYTVLEYPSQASRTPTPPPTSLPPPPRRRQQRNHGDLSTGYIMRRATDSCLRREFFPAHLSLQQALTCKL